jgi:hypothetical protein
MSAQAIVIALMLGVDLYADANPLWREPTVPDEYHFTYLATRRRPDTRGAQYVWVYRGQRGQFPSGSDRRYGEHASRATIRLSIGRDRLGIGEAKAASITMPRQSRGSRSGMWLLRKHGRDLRDRGCQVHLAAPCFV